MSRDDLIKINAGIVIDVSKKVLEYSPDAAIIIVSNPLDVMTYAAHKATGKGRNKVFGMAGVLDTARYRAFLATELEVSPRDIQALLMGVMAILWCHFQDIQLYPVFLLLTLWIMTNWMLS
jgi:malate dehydrogenase